MGIWQPICKNMGIFQKLSLIWEFFLFVIRNPTILHVENRTRNQMWQPPSPATATADHRDRRYSSNGDRCSRRPDLKPIRRSSSPTVRAVQISRSSKPPSTRGSSSRRRWRLGCRLFVDVEASLRLLRGSDPRPPSVEVPVTDRRRQRFFPTVLLLSSSTSLPDPVVSRRQSVVLFRSASSPSFLQSKHLFCQRSSQIWISFFSILPSKSTCICFCQKSNMLLF